MRAPKETWRDLIRKPEGLSWRNRERMWGFGIAGILFVFVTIHVLFFQGHPVAIEKVVGSCFGAFVVGVAFIATSVSQFLIYYRSLTDKGLLWAGAIYRAGMTVMAPALLIIICPWNFAGNGRASFVESVALCVVTLAFSVGFGVVPLIRLVCAYRNRDLEERKPAKQKKTPPKKVGFWLIGGILLVVFLICLLLEFQYQKVKAEYEVLYEQSMEVLLGQRQKKDFDEERYDEVADTYHTLDRWVHRGRYSVEFYLTLSGFGLLLWSLTLVGRLFSRAAQRSVERDERRAQRRLEKERDKDPWE